MRYASRVRSPWLGAQRSSSSIESSRVQIRPLFFSWLRPLCLMSHSWIVTQRGASWRASFPPLHASSANLTCPHASRATSVLIVLIVSRSDSQLLGSGKRNSVSRACLRKHAAVAPGKCHGPRVLRRRRPKALARVDCAFGRCRSNFTLTHEP